METSKQDRAIKLVWVAGAITMGSLLAFAVSKKNATPYAFLDGAQLVADGSPESASVRYPAHVRTYLLSGDQDHVRDLALREERDAIAQSDGWVVPRVENGRLAATYPPRRSLRFERASGGKTLVEVVDFATPTPLDGLLSRLRRTLGI